MRRKAIHFAVILLVAALSAGAAFGSGYEIVDLGTFGGDYSGAYDVNDAGQVVGYAARSDGTSAAFIWDPTTQTMTELDTLGGASAYGYAINNYGAAAGSSSIPAQSAYHACVWFPGQPPIDLDPSTGWASATDINNLGWVCGSTSQSIGASGAFVWDPTTQQMTALGDLGGGIAGASGINDGGYIVGWSYLDPSHMQGRAFLWDPATQQMQDLGVLQGYDRSQAQAINNLGQIVGQSYSSSGSGHACLWEAGGIVDLGTLGGQSVGLAINDAGRVVGAFDSGGYNYHAFIWEGGLMYDLNDLIDQSSGWTLDVGLGINEDGWIVGVGDGPGGDNRAYLLKPIPEPGSLLVLGTGALGMFFFRRRRR